MRRREAKGVGLVLDAAVAMLAAGAGLPWNVDGRPGAGERVVVDDKYFPRKGR